MKTTISIFTVLFILNFSAGSLFAQDFMKVNPKGKEIKADTSFARAIVVEFAPGQVDPMHTHPAHFFYALTDGKLKVTYADGKEQIYDLKAGESGVSGPEGPHSTENMSAHAIKFLLVELPEHPYKEGKKK